MKNIKELVLNELKARKIPVIEDKFISNRGVKLIRRTYKGTTFNEKYRITNYVRYEDLEIHTYNYITEKEMRKIVNKIKKTYKNPQYYLAPIYIF